MGGGVGWGKVVWAGGAGGWRGSAAVRWCESVDCGMFKALHSVEI